jgi:hypothetical protein
MKKLLFTSLLMLVTACAHAVGGEGMPIIVMAEDSDPHSVKRSSDVHRRVMTEMQRQFADYDWYVIDESAVAAKMGWSFKDRRPKEELIQVVDLACTSKDATLCPRALVVFKIRAMGKDYGFGTKAQVRLNGDIYDVSSNKYLGGWEPMNMEFAAPRQCDGVCIEEIVGDHARDIAASLGNVLSEKLAHLQRGSASANTASPQTDQGLVNDLVITFRNFKMREILEFTEIMEKEFPKFVTVRGTSGDATVYNYNYATRASATDIYKWMNIMFSDMGYEQEEFRITMRKNRQFSVEKMFSSPARKANTSSRFN